MSYQGMFHSDESLRDYEDQYFNDFVDDLYEDEDIEREEWKPEWDEPSLTYDDYVAYNEDEELPEDYDAV